MDFNIFKHVSQRNDYSVLIVCMVISLFIWFTQKLSTEHTIQTSLEIEWNVPDSRAFQEDPISDITVRMKGTGWNLLFSSRQLALKKPLIELSEEFEQRIDSRMIREAVRSVINDNKLQLLEIEPSLFDITLTQTFQKKVPVALISSINFYPDHDISTPIQVEPDSITIYGPQQLLDSISQWETEELKVKNIKDDLARTIKLKSPEKPSLKLSTYSVIVTIEVEEFTEKVMELPINILSRQLDVSKLKTVPDRARIYAVLPLDMYDLVNEDEFKLTVQVESLADISKNKRIKLDLTLYPGYIKSFKIYPSNIEIYQIE